MEATTGKTTTSTFTICAFCDLPPNGKTVLKVCSRCKNVAYHDAECQKKHWKVHKQVCGQKEDDADDASDDDDDLDVHEGRILDAVSIGDLDQLKELFLELGNAPSYCFHAALSSTSNPRTQETILMMACANNDTAMVRYLLERHKSNDGGYPDLNEDDYRPEGGFFVNTIDVHLGTALHRAVQAHNNEIINLLLDNGAHVDMFIARPFLYYHLQYLDKNTNLRMKEGYEMMFDIEQEMEGGWPDPFIFGK
mmetsp:Transcript_49559/g.53474  ORF Transcript_49559/g.53474 Transcript_49559/m.53474 type:complete len:251 (-) Transcript_49559:301-1053(-)